MGLWLPQSEVARAQDERRRYIAGLVQQRELHGQIAEWNRIVKEIDPALEVIKAPENATHPSLKPGYWHVIRHGGSEAPPAIIPHEGPDGEYRDLDSSLLERLRKGDMWSARSMKAMTDRNKKAQRAAERARETERERRVDEVFDRYKAKFNPGVLIKNGIPK